MSVETPNSWSARTPVCLGFFTLAILIAGFGLWSVNASIEGAIIVPGRIEKDLNRQVVQHDTGGVVSQVLVAEGDLVAAGDVLLELDPQVLRSDLVLVEGQLHETMATRARLQAERDGAARITFDGPLLRNAALAPLIAGQERLFDARRQTLDRQEAQLDNRRARLFDRLGGIVAQDRSLLAQLGLLESELISQQALLRRGLTRSGIVLTLQGERLRIQSEIQALDLDRLDARGELSEIDVELENLVFKMQQDAMAELPTLRVQESGLRERQRALKAQIDQLSIRAPVSGIVYALTAQTAQTVTRAAEPLLWLVPQDRPMVIVANLPPIRIDEIFLGQPVSLRLTAFDQSLVRDLTGHITQISADTVLDEVTGQRHFRLQITLSDSEVAKLPPQVTLMPGMPVDAFIQTAGRSPLAYLTAPLMQYFNRAFRES